MGPQSNHKYVFSPYMWFLIEHMKNNVRIKNVWLPDKHFTVGVAYYMYSFSFKSFVNKQDLRLFPSSLKIFLALQYTHKLNTTAVMAHSKVGIGQE